MLHQEWPDPIRKVEPKGIVGPIGILMGDIVKKSEGQLIPIGLPGCGVCARISVQVAPVRVVTGVASRLKESRFTKIRLLICGIWSRSEGFSGNSVIVAIPKRSENC